MTLSIHDVLNRRSDLSTFLVHLTRDRVEGVSAAANLEAIIRERRLLALTPMGWAKREDDPLFADQQSQRVVCFSETPLEHIYSLFADISGRSVKLQPYGLALTKIVARRLGVQPVWYVDMTTNGGREWQEARALDRLRDEAVEAGEFHSSALAKILPFFEHMGTWPNSRKEFWWEREWRCRGDVDLTVCWNRIIWLCPEAERQRFKELVREHSPTGATANVVCIDPSWGLEQLVGRLCDFEPEDISLFHASARQGESPQLVEALRSRIASAATGEDA